MIRRFRKWLAQQWAATFKCSCGHNDCKLGQRRKECWEAAQW